MTQACTLVDTDEPLDVQTAEQCYGQELRLSCPAAKLGDDTDQLLQITRAYYRQSAFCRGDFHSVFCARAEPHSPACVGERRCSFTAPWHYISRECGYSNAFMVAYKCVPREYT